MKAGFASSDIGWADAAARPAFESAMQAMRETGVQFVEVALPDLPYGALADVIIGAEEASIFEPLIRGRRSGTSWPMRPGQPALQANLRDSGDGVFESDADSLPAQAAVPGVVRPCVGRPETPGPVRCCAEDYASRSTGRTSCRCRSPTDARHDRRLIQAGNLAGHARATLPCGIRNGNLPLGLQFSRAGVQRKYAARIRQGVSGTGTDTYGVRHSLCGPR